MSPPAPPPRPARADGEAARERLLLAGLKLFAQQGFAKTSTRELAEAAQVNVAAISYYFGDKAGLYRAAFFEPLGQQECPPAMFGETPPTLDEALRVFFTGMLEPLKLGDVARWCMKLRFREMVDPTGLWAEELSQDIGPMHELLVDVLRRHLGLRQADDELRRLAICIAGLAVHLHVGRDVIDAVAPGLTAGEGAWDEWADRLVSFATAMVDAEQRRREQLRTTPKTARRGVRSR